MATRCVLPDGRRHPRWPGMQDTASQFVQLSWLFTPQPELLRPGSVVELPLALPRSVDRWVYDVLDEGDLSTRRWRGAGVARQAAAHRRPGGDLSAEVWFAPSLQYLPARIRIAQDGETLSICVLARRPRSARSR